MTGDRRRPLHLLCCLAVGACLTPAVFASRAPADAGPHQTLRAFVGALYQKRAAALLTGRTAVLRQFYGSGNAAETALEHENLRTANLHAWLRLHSLRLRAVWPNLRLVHPEMNRRDRATVYITLSALLSYCDPDGRMSNTFGYTTYHVLVAERAAGRWRVASEWYEDPLDECAVAGDGGAGLAAPLLAAAPRETSAARLAAGRYADRYCGVAVPGCADGRYNRRYRDFTFDGGDCANFVSQVLTDREAGGLDTDWSWFSGGGGGTVAWTKADALVHHLLDTGRATLLYRLPIDALMARTDLSRLRPGDVVAYQHHGAIRHVAVVTCRDWRGWPLVDSHTVDRYHCPFDLGWSGATVFWLLQTALP